MHDSIKLIEMFDGWSHIFSKLQIYKNDKRSQIEEVNLQTIESKYMCIHLQIINIIDFTLFLN